MAYKPTMDDIKKLRTMTGAGLGDVKKSLVEAEGDFDKAKDLLRGADWLSLPSVLTARPPTDVCS